MRAVRFHRTGDSSVLLVEDDVPVPEVTDDEILVKVEYAGVNFVDIYQRNGLYPVKLPAIAGREGAGTIVYVGQSVPASYALAVGDRVGVFAQGTLAEYVAVPAGSAMKLPSSVSTRLGAAVMLQGLTAWTIVKDAHQVEKGQWILVQAAAGGTGGLMVQICKYLGATVIGTVSTEQKAETAKQHGCDHVIHYKKQNVLSEVLKLTGGKGCHAVLSGVGMSTFDADLAATRRKGTLVSYGNSSGPVINFKILDLSKKNVKLARPTLANYIAEREEFVERTQQLLELLDKKHVSVPIGGEYGLDTVGEAQDDLTSQRTTGKLIVKVDG
ncbi:Alcohol dehydrogenase GroES-like domain-containing protein [Cladophialophora immunda]|nr:Alcohol dehydrogenase GroES-like domain-containing protein [Cladophialophora immunda]